MKISTLKPIAAAINAGDLVTAAGLIPAALATPGNGPSWHKYLGQLLELIDCQLAGQAINPRQTIIGRGGDKLGGEFMTWSTLPATSPGDTGCPGAGDCVSFCYSLKAWRYPAAFTRQAQNTILLQSEKGRELIRAAVANQPARLSIFRLYVDGDFSARAPVAGQDDYSFWTSVMRDNPIVKFYGYSKSYSQILSAITHANNYRLNISSGHNHTADTVAAVQALPIARGEFIAVTGIKVKSAAQHGHADHRARLAKLYKSETGRKAFTCPGVCHSCSPKHGHACASDKFAGVAIIIAAH